MNDKDNATNTDASAAKGAVKGAIAPKAATAAPATDAAPPAATEWHQRTPKERAAYKRSLA